MTSINELTSMTNTVVELQDIRNKLSKVKYQNLTKFNVNVGGEIITLSSYLYTSCLFKVKLKIEEFYDFPINYFKKVLAIIRYFQCDSGRKFFESTDQTSNIGSNYKDEEKLQIVLSSFEDKYVFNEMLKQIFDNPDEVKSSIEIFGFPLK